MSFSANVDVRIFKANGDPVLARKIIRIKFNGPEVKRLGSGGVGDLSERASRRLGDILGQNEHVKELSIWGCNLGMVGLGAGLQNNRCIQKLASAERN